MYTEARPTLSDFITILAFSILEKFIVPEGCNSSGFSAKEWINTSPLGGILV